MASTRINEDISFDFPRWTVRILAGSRPIGYDVAGAVLPKRLGGPSGAPPRMLIGLSRVPFFFSFRFTAILTLSATTVNRRVLRIKQERSCYCASLDRHWWVQARRRDNNLLVHCPWSC